MKTLQILLSVITSSLFAQNTAVWVGGYPANPSDWHEGRNWSDGRVPDSDTYVVIKYINSGHHSQPVISKDAEAASIKIYAQATLVISESCRLTIDGETAYSEGITTYGGNLVNHGHVFLYNLDVEISEELKQILDNKDEIIIEDRPVAANQK